jgi:hypothetical protein
MSGGLSDRERKKLQMFLIQQSKMKPSRQRASPVYLVTYPQNRQKTNVLVGNLVGTRKPTSVWFTQHALERPEALTRNQIMETIQRGVYLPNRNSYVNTKYKKNATNRGTIAPMSNAIACPKRRITNGERTVVLSFCYPRGFIRPMWSPNVVTAYKN